MDPAVAQSGFSTASRFTNARTPEGIDARPGRQRSVVVHRRATRRRCQHRMVPGVTSIPTSRAGGSRNANTTIIARSAQVNRGRPTWRRGTVS